VHEVFGRQPDDAVGEGRIDSRLELRVHGKHGVVQRHVVIGLLEGVDQRTAAILPWACSTFG